MCIYDKKIITEQTLKRYKPTRLYIKELQGIKYFGKTTKDPYKYHGSGVVWKKRIKKYGIEKIKTIWVSEPYNDPYEIQEIALHFSRENQIVESELWANCKPEDGLDGGIQTEEVIKNIASKLRGQKRSDEQNLAKSERQKGIKRSSEYIAKKIGLKYKKPKARTKPNKNKGIPLPREWAEKSAKSRTGIKYPIVICPHCGKQGGSCAMPRWHFDNCKFKNNVITMNYMNPE